MCVGRKRSLRSLEIPLENLLSGIVFLSGECWTRLGSSLGLTLFEGHQKHIIMPSLKVHYLIIIMHSWFTLSSLPVYSYQCKLNNNNNIHGVCANDINKYQLRLDVQRFLWSVYYIGLYCIILYYAGPLSCILGCNNANWTTTTTNIQTKWETCHILLCVEYVGKNAVWVRLSAGLIPHSWWISFPCSNVCIRATRLFTVRFRVTSFPGLFKDLIFWTDQALEQG